MASSLICNSPIELYGISGGVNGLTFRLPNGSAGPLAQVPYCSSGWIVVDDVSLESVFASPSEAELQAIFVAAFSLPMICYLTAYGFAAVLKMISSK